MGWLRLVGSLKLQVSFAKEPYKRDLYSAKETYIFKRPTNRSHFIHSEWGAQNADAMLQNRLVGSLNYRSLLQKSHIKETYFCNRACYFKEPTNWTNVPCFRMSHSAWRVQNELRRSQFRIPNSLWACHSVRDAFWSQHVILNDSFWVYSMHVILNEWIKDESYSEWRSQKELKILNDSFWVHSEHVIQNEWIQNESSRMTALNELRILNDSFWIQHVILSSF